MDLLASEFDPRELCGMHPSLFQKKFLPSCTLTKNHLLSVGPRLYKALFHITMELL